MEYARTISPVKSSLASRDAYGASWIRPCELSAAVSVTQPSHRNAIEPFPSGKPGSLAYCCDPASPNGDRIKYPSVVLFSLQEIGA